MLNRSIDDRTAIFVDPQTTRILRRLDKWVAQNGADKLAILGVVGRGYPDSFYRVHLRIGKSWYRFESGASPDGRSHGAELDDIHAGRHNPTYHLTRPITLADVRRWRHMDGRRALGAVMARLRAWSS